MKIKILTILVGVLMGSCKTYTISPESLKSQLLESGNIRQEVEINNPLLYGNIRYKANAIGHLSISDRDGNRLLMPNSPALEMRITQKNGKRNIFYFDTVILENDSLKGSKSRFIPGLTGSIPFDSIVKIEIQDGGKDFHYKE